MAPDEELITSSLYRQCTVNPHYGGCYPSILDRIIDMIDDMSARYSRVFMFRFDIRFPDRPPWDEMSADEDNTLICAFLKDFAFYVRRKPESLTLEYLVVRAFGQSSEKPHYHILFLADGSKERHGGKLCDEAEKRWHRTLGLPEVNEGLVNHRKREYSRSQGVFTYPAQGIMLDRNSQTYWQDRDEAIEWFSYMAKYEEKGFAPPNVREFFSSRFG